VITSSRAGEQNTRFARFARSVICDLHDLRLAPPADLKTQPERLLNGTGQYVRELLTKKLINPMPPKPNKWGKKITDDVSSFDWALPKWLQKEFGWWTEDDGSLSKELTWMGGVMWMGDRGYISTLHHDWVHQMLTQISKPHPRLPGRRLVAEP